MNAGPALQATGLSVRFGPSQVVDDVSLTLARGERLALVGESGCGKSTTALALLDLLPEAATLLSGRVLLEGREVLGRPERERRRLRGRRIALVPQDAGAALNPVIPVGRQVATVLARVHDISRREAGKRAATLFGEVGLTGGPDLSGRRPHELSGGQCQRVMIAMALGCEPAVLVADEPTSALDVTTQARVMDRLAAMTGRRGTALLLITHDLALAGLYCERGLVMYSGRVVESAHMATLLRAPAHPYSAGLLAAAPRLRGPRRGARPIPGGMPSPDARPPGCLFEPRCPRATGRCRESRPEIGDDGRGRAACFHPLAGPDDD